MFIYCTTVVLNIKKIENKNFDNLKMSIKNKKIDFDKNSKIEYWPQLCKQNLKNDPSLVKIGRDDREISAYTDTHTHPYGLSLKIVYFDSKFSIQHS